MEARRVDEGSREAAAVVALVFRKFRRNTFGKAPHIVRLMRRFGRQLCILEDNNSKYRQNA
jgi:hypothetical protein